MSVKKRNPYYVGTSVTTQQQMDSATETWANWLSIEPILEPITIKVKGEFLGGWDWIVIGAETGNRKDKVVPRREWIENIVRQCDEEDVPIFMKDSLIPIVGEENMRREFPWEVR